MSEKAANRFWDIQENQLVSFPSVFRRPYGMTYVAEIPKEYTDESTGLKSLGMMAYRDYKTGDEYIIFVRADLMPLRYNIKKEQFESITFENDYCEWRKYEEKQS